MNRSPRLQEVVNRLAEGLDPRVVRAADHSISCRCDDCLYYWSVFGNEEEGYGPFDREEIMRFRLSGNGGGNDKEQG